MGSAPRRGSSARREDKLINNHKTSEFTVKSRPLRECEMAIFARTEQHEAKEKAPRLRSSSNNRKSNTSGGSNSRKRSFNITDLDDSVASRARR
jgi:hypothetical protein